MSRVQILLDQAEKIFRHNRQGSFKTRERYEEAFKRFCRFLDKQYRLEKLKNIAPKHLRAYVVDMRERELSPATIKTELSAIRFWYDKIPEARNRLPDNSELNLERRSFAEVDRAWSQAEFSRLILVCWQHKRDDYVALTSLARYAGLRIHECFRIDTATAENALKTGEIRIKGKGGKYRTVPIQQTIRIALRDMLKVTKRGHKLFVPDGVKTDVAIKRYQDFLSKHRSEFRDPENDYNLTFHGLRHTYAAEKFTEFTKIGKSARQAKLAVSQLLGHGRDDVTRIYLTSLKDREGSEC